jgi:hypothetical protein
MATCGQCGAAMQKVADRGGGLKLPVVGLLIVGVGLLFVFPAGTAIGGFLIIAAFILGYPRKKTWKCEKCDFEHV